jgi:hypothetical protein
MNEFIKNLMDPFNNATNLNTGELNSYYDEYYDLYGIEKKDKNN